MKAVASLLLLCLLAAGCTSSVGTARVHIGVLHDMDEDRRNPDPTRPLNEDVGAAAIADQPGKRPGQASAAEEVGSGALGALLLWLSTGRGKDKHHTLPMLQVAGTFDEVVLFRWLADALGISRVHRK